MFSSHGSLCAAVCQSLCGSNVLCASLCSLLLFTMCHSGYLVGGLHHGWAPHRKAAVPRNWPYPSTLTACCVSCTDAHSSCCWLQCMRALSSGWQVVDAAARVTGVCKLWSEIGRNYTVTVEHSARRCTQITGELMSILISIKQWCPDPSEVVCSTCHSSPERECVCVHGHVRCDQVSVEVGDSSLPTVLLWSWRKQRPLAANLFMCSSSSDWPQWNTNQTNRHWMAQAEHSTACQLFRWSGFFSGCFKTFFYFLFVVWCNLFSNIYGHFF